MSLRRLSSLARLAGRVPRRPLSNGAIQAASSRASLRTLSRHSQVSPVIASRLDKDIQLSGGYDSELIRPETAGKQTERESPAWLSYLTTFIVFMLSATLWETVAQSLQVNAASPDEDTKKKKQDTGDLKTRLRELVNSAPVIVFMKGTSDNPKCDASRALVSILKEQGIKCVTFDILADEEVQQGLQTYSNCTTYPQLYVSGVLVGGLEDVQEIAKSGELRGYIAKQATLNRRLKELINKDHVMVFMKGEPAEPRCPFSRNVVKILQHTGVKYSHFDILEDDEVRQGLKKYSNCPTYPQIYVGGELIGGLDILKELKKSGKLTAILNGKQ